MFALLIASILLPSVLGACCLPNKYSSIVYADEEPNRAVWVLVNFEKGKMYMEDVDTSYDVEFRLHDINNGKAYTKQRNGVCTYVMMPTYAFDTFHQCMDNGVYLGSFTMGNGVDVVSYELKGKYSETHLMLSKDKCLPVLSILIVRTQKTVTSVFANMTYTNVDDSALDQDLSTCVLQTHIGV